MSFGLSLFEDALNAILAAFAGLVNAVISAWPIAMPSLPDTPDALLTAFAWLRWSPIPVDAIAAFFAFYVVVQVAWLVAKPVFNWLKVFVD